MESVRSDNQIAVGAEGVAFGSTRNTGRPGQESSLNARAVAAEWTRLLEEFAPSLLRIHLTVNGKDASTERFTVGDRIVLAATVEGGELLRWTLRDSDSPRLGRTLAESSGPTTSGSAVRFEWDTLADGVSNGANDLFLTYTYRTPNGTERSPSAPLRYRLSISNPPPVADLSVGGPAGLDRRLTFRVRSNRPLIQRNVTLNQPPGTFRRELELGPSEIAMRDGRREWIYQATFSPPAEARVSGTLQVDALLRAAGVSAYQRLSQTLRLPAPAAIALRLSSPRVRLAPTGTLITVTAQSTEPVNGQDVKLFVRTPDNREFPPLSAESRGEGTEFSFKLNLVGTSPLGSYHLSLRSGGTDLASEVFVLTGEAVRLASIETEGGGTARVGRDTRFILTFSGSLGAAPRLRIRQSGGAAATVLSGLPGPDAKTWILVYRPSVVGDVLFDLLEAVDATGDPVEPPSTPLAVSARGSGLRLVAPSDSLPRGKSVIRLERTDGFPGLPEPSVQLRRRSTAGVGLGTQDLPLKRDPQGKLFVEVEVKPGEESILTLEARVGGSVEDTLELLGKGIGPRVVIVASPARHLAGDLLVTRVSVVGAGVRSPSGVLESGRVRLQSIARRVAGSDGLWELRFLTGAAVAGPARLVVTALDDAGNSGDAAAALTLVSARVAAPAPAPGPGVAAAPVAASRRAAILIGFQDYTRLPRLSSTRKDLAKLARALSERGYAADAIRLMTDARIPADPTPRWTAMPAVRSIAEMRPAVERALADVRAAGAESLVIAFVGHGYWKGGRLHLCAPDSRQPNPPYRSIEVQQLVDQVFPPTGGGSIKNLWLILDTTRDPVCVIPAAVRPPAQPGAGSGGQLVVLTAAASNQLVQVAAPGELPGTEGGLFIDSLARELRRRPASGWDVLSQAVSRLLDVSLERLKKKRPTVESQTPDHWIEPETAAAASGSALFLEPPAP